MSFMFAVKKVYPNLTKYMLRENITAKAIMELYDCAINKSI